jgi:hypothetical protein
MQGRRIEKLIRDPQIEYRHIHTCKPSRNNEAELRNRFGTLELNTATRIQASPQEIMLN